MFPRYKAAMLSATSNTSFKLWLIKTTAKPLSARRRTRLRTCSVWATPSAAVNYWARVKAGDIGSLPAILGLVVLCLVFGSMSSVFLTPGNFANLITQAAAVIVIAMGLVFVLLLGEIDLSAGYTAGVTGAVLVILITNEGQPWYVALIASIAVGALLGFMELKKR